MKGYFVVAVVEVLHTIDKGKDKAVPGEAHRCLRG
jgi:hypothetical protein